MDDDEDEDRTRGRSTTPSKRKQAPTNINQSPSTPRRCGRSTAPGLLLQTAAGRACGRRTTSRRFPTCAASRRANAFFHEDDFEYAVLKEGALCPYSRARVGDFGTVRFRGTSWTIAPAFVQCWHGQAPGGGGRHRASLFVLVHFLVCDALDSSFAEVLLPGKLRRCQGLQDLRLLF